MNRNYFGLILFLELSRPSCDHLGFACYQILSRNKRKVQGCSKSCPTWVLLSPSAQSSAGPLESASRLSAEGMHAAQGFSQRSFCNLVLLRVPPVAPPLPQGTEGQGGLPDLPSTFSNGCISKVMQIL